MKVVTIKFESVKEWNFLLELLKRLNLRFEWKDEAPEKPSNNSPSADAVSKLFGSFPSSLSSDEMVQMLQESRVNQTREIAL